MGGNLPFLVTLRSRKVFAILLETSSASAINRIIRVFGIVFIGECYEI